MALVIKPSGSISYTEINTSVVNAGGFATSSFNGLNAQAYSLTNSSVYLPPDRFSEFVGTSGNVFTFTDWTGNVTISSLGSVTYALGNVTSMSVTPTSYSVVGTPTSRSVGVSLIAPTGYTNVGSTITGTKSVVQPANNYLFSDWTGTVSINEDGVVSYTTGNASAVAVTPTSYSVVSTSTSRTVDVSLTAPSGYYNVGASVTGSVTTTQPPKLFTFGMWTGTLSVSCDGVISATTGNGATPITFSPTSYSAVDTATTRTPTITVTVPSGYGNSNSAVSGSKSATQPAKFLTTTWTGAVSINKNTGEVSATTGNAASIQSITPSTVDLVTTPTSRSITVVIVIPSGYCNSGTLSITKTVTQAAADETINITLGGTHNTWNPNPQGDSALLSVYTVAVWNTAWTIEVSDASWIIIEAGTSGTTGTGTQVNYGTIAVTGNYSGSPGYNGSTRYGSIRVYKTGAYNSIYDIIYIQQAVGTPPYSAPTFTMSGGNHTFGWNESGVGYSHTITVAITGGTEMSSGKFVMDSSEFAFYQTDSHITVAETSTNHWEGSVNNTGLSSYTIGVYPKANNSSTSTQKSAEISFTAQNGGGSNSDYVTVYQAVSPPAFTIGDAGIYGFAVAQNGSVTAPQSSAGTITNRSYSSGYSGGSYPRVNVNTERSVVVTVQVPGGYSNSGDTVSGTYYATQQASATFAFGDTGATGFFVAQDGSITAPYVTSGTITSITYNNSVGNSYYQRVSSNTTRTATIYVTVPGGYYNSGGEVSGNVSTTQEATPTFTFITANVTGFAVATDGAVTQPTAQYGGIVSRTYSSGYSDGYYPIVSTDTYRSVYVVINVPSGYINSGGQVSGTVEANQLALPTFTYGNWNGSVSVGMDGNVSYSTGNAAAVSVSPSSYGVVYSDTSRTINVTVYVPSGYYNTGGIVTGTYTTTQPGAPADPVVTVYTICDTGANYFKEGTYYYPNITIGGYCAYYSESTTRSVAEANGYTEFFSISPSGCTCG